MSPPSRRYTGLLVRYLKPQRRRVALLAVLLLGSIALQLVSPQIVRFFIDTAQSGGPQSALIKAALAFLAFALGARAVQVAADYVAVDTGWTATNALRADLARHALDLDMPFHKRHTPGELIERIDGDTAALANFFSQFTIRVIGNALLAAGILVLLFREDWRVGIGLTVYSLLTVLALSSVQKAAVPRWTAERQTRADLFGFIEERIAGREEIQAAGAEAYTLQRLYHLLRMALIRLREALIVSHFTEVIGRFLYVIGYAVGLSLAAYLYLRGESTIGTAYLIVYYVGMLAAPLDGVRQEVQDLQRASASVERANNLLAERSRVRDGTGGPLPAGALDVEFENVTFRYEDGDTAAGAAGGEPEAVFELQETGYDAEGSAEPIYHALRDVSFRLQAGRVLGLLGRTGSGKSTLARLLFRLYDPAGGTIRLGGVDVCDLPLSELRSRVGIVTQDVQLFQATLRDNLTLFGRATPDELLIQLQEELGLWSWVRSLPRGLDTELAAGGEGLSAGEAQLLAFSRVFLQDPGLVILDEASSRLDPATEALLERAVERLLRGRTAIIIAHRLHTVLQADDLLILENGQAVEWGARESLAANPDSRYSQLLRTGLEEALQ
jgi:ABC-type multidrug transport system fused ATPase/permease subunit